MRKVSLIKTLEDVKENPNVKKQLGTWFTEILEETIEALEDLGYEFKGETSE